MPIEIGFSVPDDGSIGSLISKLKLLVDETNLSKQAMLEIPIDELNRKMASLSVAIADVSAETAKKNQNTKADQDALISLKSTITSLVSDMNNCIKVQTLWNETSKTAQKEINSISEKMIAASKAIEFYNKEIERLNESERETGKLSAGNETKRLKAIEMLDKLSSSTKTYSDILTLYNTKTREVTQSLELNSGWVKETTDRIKELTSSLTNNAEADKLAIDEIASLNVQLNYLKTNISGVLNEESALNKVIEQNIVLQNKANATSLIDVDTKARLAIANKELALAVEDSIAIQTGAYTRNELAMIKMYEEEEAISKAYYDQMNVEEQRLIDLKIAQMVRENKAHVAMLDQELLDEQKANKASLELELKKVESKHIANMKMIADAEKREIKEIEVAVKLAEANEVSASKSIISWEGFTNIFERMGLRMLASMVWWTLIIGAATELYELWTKVSDETKRAQDALKDYFDSFQQLQKLKDGAMPKIVSGTVFDTRAADTQKDILNNNVPGQNYTIDQRYDAYVKLNQLAPKILDDIKQEDFARRLLDDRMKAQLETTDKFISKNKELENQKQLMQSSLLAGETNKQQYETKIKEYTDKYLSPYANGKKLKENVDSLESYLKKQETKESESDLIVHSYDSGPNKMQKELMKLIREQKSNLKDQLESDAERDRLEKEIAALQGDNKTPKGKTKQSEKLLPIKLREEKADYEDKVVEAKKEFELSNRSLDEKLKLYEKEDNLTKDHYEKNLEIIAKYGKIDGESKSHLDQRRKTALKEQDSDNLKIIEARRKDLQSFKEYEDAKMRSIEEADIKLKMFNMQSQRQIDEYNKNERKNKLEHDVDSDPDLVGAFFGTSGDRKRKVYRNKLASKNEDISIDERNLLESAKIGISAESKVKKTSSGLTSLDMIPDAQRTDEQKEEARKIDSAKSPEQLKIDEQKRKDYLQALDEKKKADDKYNSDNLKLQQDNAEKTKIIDLKKREEKIAIAKEISAGTEKIVNLEFDAQRKRIKQQMEDVQNLANFEMTLAGNNTAAKIRLQKSAHDKMMALKRKEAENEKTAAEFSASVSMAKGIVGAISNYPGPVGFAIAGMIAAEGIFEIGKISSQKLPAYKKGRKGGPSETALINEDGFELIENNGKFRLDNGGYETITNLNSGDIVHTHKDSISLLQKNDSFLQSLLIANSVINKRDFSNKIETQKFVTKSEFRDAMIDAVKHIPKQDIVLPANHVVSRFNEQQNRMR